jgi:hypothetical protein
MTNARCLEQANRVHQKGNILSIQRSLSTCLNVNCVRRQPDSPVCRRQHHEQKDVIEDNSLALVTHALIPGVTPFKWPVQQVQKRLI